MPVVNTNSPCAMPSEPNNSPSNLLPSAKSKTPGPLAAIGKESLLLAILANLSEAS